MECTLVSSGPRSTGFSAGKTRRSSVRAFFPLPLCGSGVPDRSCRVAPSALGAFFVAVVPAIPATFQSSSLGPRRRPQRSRARGLRSATRKRGNAGLVTPESSGLFPTAACRGEDAVGSPGYERGMPLDDGMTAPSCPSSAMTCASEPVLSYTVFGSWNTV